MIEIPIVKDNEDTILAKTTNDIVANTKELDTRLKAIESNPGGGGGSTVSSADGYIRRSIKNKMNTIMDPSATIMLAFSERSMEKSVGDYKILIDDNEWNNNFAFANYQLDSGEVDNIADPSLLDTGIAINRMKSGASFY